MESDRPRRTYPSSRRGSPDRAPAPGAMSPADAITWWTRFKWLPVRTLRESESLGEWAVVAQEGAGPLTWSHPCQGEFEAPTTRVGWSCPLGNESVARDIDLEVQQ